MQYLLLDIYAPLMSWGAPSKSNYRPTHRVPTKSAILGMIAAAVGIDRKDVERKVKFYSSYELGTAVLSRSESNETTDPVLIDYHTVSIRKLGKYLPLTRKEELEDEEFLPPDTMRTVVSRREYLQDAAYIVAIRAKEGHDSESLDDLRESILRPHFPLYFGRRSCPPAMPLNPRIVEASDFQSVLAIDEDSGFLALQKDEKPFEIQSIYWEGESEEQEFDRRIQRRDEPTGKLRNAHSNRTIFVKKVQK